jgi:hypothetical protein
MYEIFISTTAVTVIKLAIAAIFAFEIAGVCYFKKQNCGRFAKAKSYCF